MNIDTKADALAALNKKLIDCSRCPLRESATQVVLGCGNPNAKYMLIGEAPGSNEDKAGIPFVGAAGKKLDTLLALAGINPEDCYLTNVCRCRPPKNRQPRKKEIRTCAEWLSEEIEIVQPETIITLGSIPLSLFCPYGVKQMHGTMFSWESNENKSN